MKNKLNSKIAILFLLFLLFTRTCAAASDSTGLIKNDFTRQNCEKPVTLNFQEIGVRAVLELLAEFAGLDIIASDTITGTMTLHLASIPWEQALNVILRSQGLGKRQIGKVLIIAPLNELIAREKQALEAEQQIKDLVPLHSELMTIHYGKATDIANLLQGQDSSLLSNRGNVSADARTNTIWVEDNPQKLAEVHSLIKRLDVPVKQVLIEAKIVNADCDFERELGIRFGMTQPKTSDGIHPVAATDDSFSKHLIMDFPADKIAGVTPATIGIALARLSKGTLLDLELSALESEGSGKIISSPRLITADQQTAQIQSGEEVPYQQTSSSGATNIAFKEAVLSLFVTPQITPENKILLTLKLNQDKVGSRVVQGVPSIDTRQIETQILTEDGETVVLGGIYETGKTKRIKRIPLLGSLPYVGSLFRHSSISTSRKELLIFVTPHIL